MTVSGLAAIQLVAIDLDGTLLDSYKTISPRCVQAIAAAQTTGMHIVIASARPPRSVRKFYRQLQLTTPQINYNGALVWNEPTRQHLLHAPLAATIALDMIHQARQQFPKLLVSVETLDRWYTDHLGPLADFELETAKEFTPDYIGPLDPVLTDPITKLMLMGEDTWIDTLELAFRDYTQVALARSDGHMLQLMAPQVSKGSGLAWVADYLGVPATACAAIGDAANDLPMLQWAGHTFAVANAWPQVRDYVQHMLPSHDEDGVAKGLELILAARENA